MRPSLAFIGAGRLGQALAKRFFALGYPITGIHSQSPARAQALALTVDSQVTPSYPQADVLFLTVPDGQISLVAQRLAQQQRNCTAIHCSGVHGLEALAPLHKIGSFHPLYPFREGSTLQGDEGMLIAIEAGDDSLAQQLMDLGQALGGRPALLRGGMKAQYHAAAAIASNYLVTLFSISLGLMHDAGIPLEIARAAIAQLMQGNIDNLRQIDPSEALTGPIARGDLHTIALHILALSPHDYTNLYCELGRQTVKLAPNLDHTTRQQLLALLNPKDF
jgi:predicted short-subunit dehydrogenase-like oxidoreductase (DUF2520 family)